MSILNTSDELRPRGIKTDRIFRILLNNPGGNLTRYRISVLAKAQQIQVAILLRRLEAMGLVGGTRVTDYRRLMMEWMKREIKFPTQRYMLKSIMELLRNASIEYALTTYQAETLVNGYLFPTKTELYIHQHDFDRWHGELVRAGALVGGGNVTLRLYDEGVFYNSFTTRDGYRIVSMPQLIVDLMREGGVATEAAEMLLQKQIESAKRVRKARKGTDSVF